MTACCPHPENEHHLIPICHEVIHYPSEDYPCLCGGLEGEGARCAECEHPAASHDVQRVCKPAGGEYCGCRR